MIICLRRLKVICCQILRAAATSTTARRDFVIVKGSYLLGRRVSLLLPINPRLSRVSLVLQLLLLFLRRQILISIYHPLNQALKGSIKMPFVVKRTGFAVFKVDKLGWQSLY